MARNGTSWGKNIPTKELVILESLIETNFESPIYGEDTTISF